LALHLGKVKRIFNKISWFSPNRVRKDIEMKKLSKYDYKNIKRFLKHI